MKKFLIALTLPLLFCLMVLAGPEPLSNKDKEVVEPAPPPCDFFRAHEWDISMWGTYVFSANPGKNNVPNDDPFTPDLDPEILISNEFAPPTIEKPQGLNPDERIDLGRQTRDAFLDKDDSWGGGMDVKYFWSKYFGVGVEGFLVDTNQDLGGAGLATLTARYPIGRFAPYMFVGAGALAGGGRTDHIFHDVHTYSGGFVTSDDEFFTDENIKNHDVFFDGQVGAGVEVRLTCHIGLMADFAWNFVAGGSGDRRETVTSPGGTNFDGPVPVTFPNNTAVNIVPGSDGDKDFGMVRFGLTVSF